MSEFERDEDGKGDVDDGSALFSRQHKMTMAREEATHDVVGEGGALHLVCVLQRRQMCYSEQLTRLESSAGSVCSLKPEVPVLTAWAMPQPKLPAMASVATYPMSLLRSKRRYARRAKKACTVAVCARSAHITCEEE